MDEYLEAEEGSSKILISTMRMLKTNHNLQYSTDVVVFLADRSNLQPVSSDFAGSSSQDRVRRW